MTAMTNQSAAALKNLKFYVVTKSWFVRAWPILTAKPNDPIADDIGQNLREHIGKIQNSELVRVDTKSQTSSIDKTNEGVNSPTDETASADDTNSDDNHEGNASSQYDINRSKLNINLYHHRILENPETTKMKPGLLHTRDYFFLGPSAWMLVKQKFGYDGYEISRCCKKDPSRASHGRIAVALLPGEDTTIPTSGIEGENTNLLSTTVPLSGRFPYEKVLSIRNDASREYRDPVKQRIKINDEVS
jgi:hypothetical protein